MIGEREGLAEIAGVLAEHEYALGLKRGSICTCGHVPTIDPGSLQTQQDYHRAHLADLLAARDRRMRAQALREAADNWPREVNAENLSREMATNLREIPPEYRVDQWLRDRADRIEAKQ